MAEWQPRVKEQFKTMLDDYRKQGFEGKYTDLYFVIEQQDIVAKAFEILRDEAELKYEDLLKAYA